MNEIYDVIKYFPINIQNTLKEILSSNSKLEKDIHEIRIRSERPIFLGFANSNFGIDYIVSQTEILQILERVCENSIYAYKNQICNGFITIKGGHRIGIVGTVVIENGRVINIKYVTSLNFRIARQVIDSSNNILKEVINTDRNTIYNTLIVSPPGKGKTTILRDLIRKISNGIKEMNFNGKTCGLVDERGEIAATYKGIPQNDVGMRTDVVDNISKNDGIKMLIRSMAPEIVACDEIGTIEDVEAIEYALCSRSKRNLYNAWFKFR
ncbi:MAG: stage III sporulation protein AA [Clostridia bacterium]|nr:stage III sporulation protein AA [Clostridia bacterium]